MLNTMQKKPRYPQQELADRLRTAMDEADVNLASMARECGVTIQAVHDWRETGRIGKQHLVTICRMTGKPFEYFLVGLSRAAAVLLAVALPLLVQPQPAQAIEHNLSSALLPHKAPTNYTLRAKRWALRIWRRFQDVLTGKSHSRERETTA